ncbi:hypothetical protein [Nocardioides sp.]|uniref:hypothetical protein n=1 Tax=Nocardioides sp. TaxID=35761 RepID=UPI0035173C53
MRITHLAFAQRVGVDDEGLLDVRGMFAGGISAPSTDPGPTWGQPVVLGYDEAEPDTEVALRLVFHRPDGVVEFRDLPVRTLPTDGPRAFVTVALLWETIAAVPGRLRIDAHVVGDTSPAATVTIDIVHED